MGCASKQNQQGFTLVEIAIVMIIVGLLIGGTFGGMKLIENMQVNKTVQDLKAIESAGLTFKDTYGRLPGDIRNPSTRLPNCTVAPCATTGNGDRQINPINVGISWADPVDPAWERFTFWHHLQASDLVSLNMRNSLDPTFGEGQPTASVGSGFQVSNYTGTPWLVCAPIIRDTIVVISDDGSSNLGSAGAASLECNKLGSIDRKMDDGVPWFGKVIAGQCGICASPEYNNTTVSTFWFDVRF